MDIRRGLGSVTRIFREHKMMRVFCPLFELLDCDEKPFTAGEVTAGNSLFRVQNDDLSTKIIRQLNGQKGGRVTFIPLNRVWSPRATYPQSSDVLTLQKKLNFSHDFSPAFRLGQRRFYSESPPPFHQPSSLGGIVAKKLSTEFFKRMKVPDDKIYLLIQILTVGCAVASVYYGYKVLDQLEREEREKAEKLDDAFKVLIASIRDAKVKKVESAKVKKVESAKVKKVEFAKVKKVESSSPLISMCSHVLARATTANPSVRR